MAVLGVEEMRRFITTFLEGMHDFVPSDIHEEGIVGCFNTMYHGGIGESLVFPPVENEYSASFPVKTIVYLLREDGTIIVQTDSGETHNLDKCVGKSYEAVFACLREAYSEKVKNEK